MQLLLSFIEIHRNELSEHLFALKLDDRIVLVKCTGKYAQINGMDGATETRIHYVVSKVTTLTNEVVNAVTLLNTFNKYGDDHE